MDTISVAYKDYLITTDRNRLQPSAIHHWLSTESYWSKGIPYETVKTCFDNSYVIGVLHEDRQIGYARLVTDYGSFAYLADVYVEAGHRGKGISKQMMAVLMAQDWVKGLRRLMLATMDAHGLYAQFGFTPLPSPERIMVISKPDFYPQAAIDTATNQTATL